MFGVAMLYALFHAASKKGFVSILASIMSGV
jgi:hypothetical protein